MMLQKFTCCLLLLFATALFTTAGAQPGFSVDIKKEKPYEERKLKAEKTGEGKLKTPKRLFQNLTTHFNYVFNATNKFNEIVDRAKQQHRDDYSQLLPFYNYSLDATAGDSAQLDSVIYKCRTGIINHDLRNEWADELYLLWATSWHLQKKLDSASMMLQFINYAYAPQEEYGFYSYIGSRKEGAKELSILTPEKKKFLHSNTFSRNNSFIWQVRTQTELEKFAAAGSLLSTLKRDPLLPKRLQTDLQEAEAYWYYKQGRWDSAAHYLALALNGAETKQERARWEYLVAQLLERSGKPAQAAEMYTKAIGTTNDPVLEVYGRLNLVRLAGQGDASAVDRNVAELLKMAKKDKYEEYRDIIYFMAAQMEMERSNIGAAQDLLLKGSRFSNGNSASRARALLQIADVSYSQKKYLQAAAFYDSLQTGDLAAADAQRVEERKGPLRIITANQQIVLRQDSLQRIAALPVAEREDFLKKLVKRLRKEQGLKEDATPTAGSSFGPATAQQGSDLFSSQKGEWYFYNNNSRTQGAAEFKQVWGNRPNVDNWRRFAVVSQQLMNTAGRPGNLQGPSTSNADAVVDLSVDGLAANLPLTPESQKVSADSIRTALFTLGTTYLNELEDFPSAIAAFEEIRKRFPGGANMDETLFNLYYAHTRAGNAAEAARIKKLLTDNFTTSRFASIVTTGKDPQATVDKTPEATKAYENVYNLFIEGHFAEAIAAKQTADNTYKTTFWQPQLLYIEAVYHVKQRDDSAAKSALQTIVRQNTNPALTDKAQNLLNVLNRRQQIEEELARYQIQTAPTDTVATAVPDAPLVRRQVDAVKQGAATQTPTNSPVVKTNDAAARKALDLPKSRAVDTVVAKPPVKNVDTIAKKPTTKPADTVVKKPVVKTDTVAKKTPVLKGDSVVKKPVIKTDTVAKKTAPVVKSPQGYTFAPEATHAAIVILDKVDPVFVNEAKNAFFRFNREKYSALPLDVQIINLAADQRLLYVTGFQNAQAAVDYALRVKSLAATEIIPWLTGNKYTFSVISAANLDVLKEKQDIQAYKKFLEQNLPVKF